MIYYYSENSNKMLRKIFYFGIVLILLASIVDAQQSRTKSMGGLSFSIVDRDYSLNLFDFGNNPAWLIVDEKNSRLEITPSLNNSWGSYRRPYSADGLYDYNAGFIGIKPLGESGTFRGKADYTYELRRNNYRTLKKDTYGGEAFYFNDTTSGDVRFNGPTFEFMHSLNLFSDLYLGASASYQIMDGLKKVYTYAETLYRNVSIDLGAAYSMSDNLNVGINYKYGDSQERIVADDVNLLTVQTYHYRGDTYALLLSGTSQSYKLKKKSDQIGAQFHYVISHQLEFGLTGKYSLMDTRVLFPVSALIDVEDGYSSFKEYNVKFAAAFTPTETFKAGLFAEIENLDSWSKNSERDLLLWEWNIQDISAGIGVSTFINELDLLLGAEYELGMLSSDSLKYVDNKSITEESLDHTFRIGFEYGISELIKLRLGYNLDLVEHDFIYGGDDYTRNLFTFGGGINIFDGMELDLRFEYANTGAKINNVKLKRYLWGSLVTLRFSSF